MTRAYRAIAATLLLSSAIVFAQEAPESLLPPGFEQPKPASRTARPAQPQPAPAVRTAPAAVAQPKRAAAPAAPAVLPARPASSPVVQPVPVMSGAPEPAAPPPQLVSGRIPPLEVLEKLTPDQLDQVLGLNGRSNVPGLARRSLDRTGIIDESEGGLPADSLSMQDASLVRAAIAGNDGELVSRWGHILLRRALASRLAAPVGMDPADFAAMRAALLVRMGEAEAARALVQDVDTGAYTQSLTNAAFDAYVATGDFTGICPVMASAGSDRKDPPWQVAGYICDAFRGDPAGALSKLDRAGYRALMPKIDLLLAQKYVGAAGKGARAVTIEWSGINEITPWRYGLALADGVQPPAKLMADASPYYSWIGATAPMLGLTARADMSDTAGAAGILSSAAMVDLYGQIYADGDLSGEWPDRADKLRSAYAAPALADRLAAMQALWNEDDDPETRYARRVLTAYAAARYPAEQGTGDAAGDLIASMLAAGLDANAARWSGVVREGSPGWALLALSAPSGQQVGSGAIATFSGSDRSDKQRKSAFLVAGLAGLGRISLETANSEAGRLGVSLGGETRWTRIIDRAAQVHNPELVALLAGVGMQGDSWAKMTPRFLFHIVSALRQAGLEPEARMIAAEAVARG